MFFETIETIEHRHEMCVEWRCGDQSWLANLHWPRCSFAGTTSIQFRYIFLLSFRSHFLLNLSKSEQMAEIEADDADDDLNAPELTAESEYFVAARGDAISPDEEDDDAFSSSTASTSSPAPSAPNIRLSASVLNSSFFFRCEFTHSTTKPN